jgi:hypothetical protein
MQGKIPHRNKSDVYPSPKLTVRRKTERAATELLRSLALKESLGFEYRSSDLIIRVLMSGMFSYGAFVTLYQILLFCLSSAVRFLMSSVYLPRPKWTVRVSGSWAGDWLVHWPSTSPSKACSGCHLQNCWTLRLFLPLHSSRSVLINYFMFRLLYRYS